MQNGRKTNMNTRQLRLHEINKYVATRACKRWRPIWLVVRSP
jgi:hypothetical protein